jgi:hypothetical protein
MGAARMKERPVEREKSSEVGDPQIVMIVEAKTGFSSINWNLQIVFVARRMAGFLRLSSTNLLQTVKADAPQPERAQPKG